MRHSGIIGSLIIIGCGLALRYAVSPGVVTQVSLPTIGAILIVLGAIGFVLSLAFSIAAEARKSKAGKPPVQEPYDHQYPRQ